MKELKSINVSNHEHNPDFEKEVFSPIKDLILNPNSHDSKTIEEKINIKTILETLKDNESRKELFEVLRMATYGGMLNDDTKNTISKIFQEVSDEIMKSPELLYYKKSEGENEAAYIEQRYNEIGFRLMVRNIDHLTSSSNSELLFEKLLTNQGMLEEPALKVISKLSKAEQDKIEEYLIKKSNGNEIFNSFDDSISQYIKSLLSKERTDLKELETLLASDLEWIQSPTYNALASIYEEKFGENLSFLYPVIKSPYHITSELHKMTLDINTQRELASSDPTLVDYLKTNHGIQYFGRYPVELLLKQKKIDTDDKPYGVLVFPYADDKGAFHGNKKVLRDLCEQTKDKHNIKVYEVESAYGLMKRVNQAALNSEEKISFAIVGGHATPEVIRFSKDIRKNLYKHTLEGGATSAVNNLFKPGAEIVLLSCSAGAEDGVAQKMSTEMDSVKIIAPKEIATLIEIKTSYDENGTPHFSPDYGDKDNIAKYERGNLI